MEIDENTVFHIPNYLVAKIKNVDEVNKNIENLKADANNYNKSILNNLKFPKEINNENFIGLKGSNYKCIKINLCKIIKHNKVYDTLNELVCNIKILKIVLYLFMRSFILHESQNNPLITAEFSEYNLPKKLKFFRYRSVRFTHNKLKFFRFTHIYLMEFK